MTEQARRPHPTAAGMYDYYLGGTHNTEVDRAAAEKVIQILAAGGKDAREGAWANRGFLQRAAKWMAEQGVMQFIDIGAGLPTENNTHDIVRAVVPDARVVYIDNEPQAVAAGAELVDHLDGVAYVEGDLRDHALLDHAGSAALIDWGRPVGLLLVGVLYFVEDHDDPWAATAAHVDRLPAGSCVAISHYTLDGWRAPDTEESVREYERHKNPLIERSRAEVDRFLTGLETVPPYPGAEPELTYVGLWGAEDPEVADDDAGRAFYAAVARKTTGRDPR